MKIALKLTGGIAAVLVLLVIVAFLLPRSYRVERSALLHATPEAVQSRVADVRAWKAWGVWYERDPKMEIIYSEPATGAGAWTSWASESQGSGKLTLTAVAPNAVDYVLEFPDLGTRSTGSLSFAPEGDGTRVTWRDEGDLGMNPVNRWFGLFIERMIGPDFENSLANLGRLVER